MVADSLFVLAHLRSVKAKRTSSLVKSFVSGVTASPASPHSLSLTDFVGMSEDEIAYELLDQIIDEALRETLEREGNLTHDKNDDNEQYLCKLALDLITAVRNADFAYVEAYVKENLPLSFQHPHDGNTPLHVAAAVNPDMVRLIAKGSTKECLITNARRQYPHDVAFSAGHSAVGRYLLIKAKAEAHSLGFGAFHQWENDQAPSID